jgi:hypothetical protein
MAVRLSAVVAWWFAIGLDPAALIFPARRRRAKHLMFDDISPAWTAMTEKE